MNTQLDASALPITIGLREAGKILGIGASTSYRLAGEGQFPVRLLKLGRQYRVSRADLLAYLGEVQQPAAGASA